MMRKTLFLITFALAAWVSLPASVMALGLGNVTVESALNQPLRVRIEVLQLGDTRLEDVTVQMAAMADFQRFNIERVGFLSNVRFSFESTAQGDFVVLTSSQVVREPYLSFILDTRWNNGRLLSEHTVLLDLPVFQEESASGSSAISPISPVLEPPQGSVQPGSSASQPAPASSQPAVSQPSAAPVLEPEQIAPAPEQPEPEQSAPEQPAPEPEEAQPQASETDDQAEPAAAEDTTSPEPLSQVVEEEPVEVTEQEDPEQPEPEEQEPAAQPEADEIAADEESADASPEVEPQQPESIEVDPSDTLSDIALRVRPDSGVTIQQTMLALQRLNPDAFIDGNINRMRSGQVMRVPSRDEIDSISAQEAVEEVARQNQAIATANPQPLTAPSNAVPEDDTPSGQLSVVTPGADEEATGGGAIDNSELDDRIAELENQLAVQQEEADRARIQREELESRLAELDEQIAAAQEIIRLQDLQLAQLQESLAESAAQAEREAAAAALAAQQAAANRSTTQTPAAQGGIVDTILGVLTGNLYAMLAAAGLVVLGLVAIMLRRNRAGSADDKELDEIAEAEFPGAGGTAQESPEPRELEDFDQSELDSELDDIISIGGELDKQPTESLEIDDDPVGDDDDILSQADALIGNEQYDAAARMLQTAIASEPRDAELREKLMVALAAKQDLAAFEEQADAALELNDAELNRSVDKLRDSFSDSLGDRSYRDEETESVDSDDDTSSFLDDLGIDLDDFDDDGLEAGDEPAAEKAEDKEETTPVGNDDTSDSLLDDLDDDIDMDLTFDLADVDDEQADKEQADAEQSDLDADDFFSFDEEDGKDESVLAESVDDTDTDTDSETETDALDLDSSDDGNAELASGASKEADDLEIDSLDFDVDQDDLPGKDEPEATSGKDDLEFETFSFESTPVPDAEEDDAADKQQDSADAEQSVDFEVDLDGLDLDKEKVEDEKPTAADEDEDFDFDLDDGDLDTVIEKAEIEDSDDDAEGDADLSPGTVKPEESAKADPADNDSAEDDEFDFDLSELEIDDDELDEANSKSAMQSADDDVIDLEEGGGASKNTDEDQSDLDFLADDEDLESGETTDEDDDLDLLSDEDETATKLELAYAYKKMRDDEGAKEILQEVIKEGNAEQVEEAKKLLSSLD